MLGPTLGPCNSDLNRLLPNIPKLWLTEHPALDSDLGEDNRLHDDHMNEVTNATQTCVALVMTLISCNANWRQSSVGRSDSIYSKGFNPEVCRY